MNCSVELPIKNLPLSDLFDYDFVIASTCVEHPEYKEYFLGSTRFMILDNGAFETGESMDDVLYIELAQELRPNVLVIPDVYKRTKETLDRFHSFIDRWSKAPDVSGIELMGVIQAAGSVQVAHALGVLYQNSGISWIGVPYACELDRYQLISAHPEWGNVHILGLPVLTEVFGLLQFPNVRTIDSSLPVKAAKEGKSLGRCLTASTYASPQDESLDDGLLLENLEFFHAICHGHAKVHSL